MDIRPGSLRSPVRREQLQAFGSTPGEIQPSRERVTPVLSPKLAPSHKNAQRRGGSQAHRKLARVVPAVQSVIRQIECFVYDSGQPPKSENMPISRDEIRAWLLKPIPESFDGKPPVAGLRLLVCKQPVSTVTPFDKEISQAINAELGLPESSSYLTMFNAGSYGKYITACGQPIFIYHRSNNNGTISAVIRWSPTTNVTFGYLHLGPRISLHKVAAELTSQFPSFSHPLFIPTYVGECTAADLLQELYHIHLLLARAEEKTRFGDWELHDEDIDVMSSDDNDNREEVNSNKKSTVTVVQTPAVNAFESYKQDKAISAPTSRATTPSKFRYWEKMEAIMDAGVTDHNVLSRILGALSCRFVFMDAAVGCSIESAEFTLREMDQMRIYCGSAARDRQLEEVVNGDGLQHRIELLLSNLKHIKAFGAIAQRMQAQQNVLFNLVAHEDNVLNRGIAEDSKQLAEASKRDSSAMKIVAFLTTVFLPGTFVSTFFAMPLFNWGEHSMANVMTDHFWIYWTVTLPLTLLVMGIVGLYAWNQSQWNKIAADKARKRAIFKEA